jgi:hypothetical protein
MALTIRENGSNPLCHTLGASFKTDNGVAPSKAEVDAIQQYLHTLK